MGQTIYLERDQYNVSPGLDLLDLAGRLVAQVPGPGGRLEAAGSRVLRHGQDPVLDVDVEWVAPYGSVERLGVGSSAFADPRGGATLFVHVAGGSALQRVNAGNVVSQLLYPAQRFQLQDCPLAIVPSGATAPGCPMAWASFDLSD